MLDINPDGKTMLLSLDGGGMRGVISIAMLAYLEEQTGKPAYELFNMIGGTSTGAIIATGLALGMSAKDILRTVYRERLPGGFGKSAGSRLMYFIFGTGLKHFYPVEPFINVLGDLAPPGLRMRDLGKLIKDEQGQVRLCQPDESPDIDLKVLMTTKDIRTGNTYFLVNAGPGAAMFGDWTVKAALSASSVAPIFFPPVIGNFVDGGVGIAGNPCLVTSVEAVAYMNIPADQIRHISLGTGYVPTEKSEGAASKFWLKEWLEYMLLEYVEDAAYQQVKLTEMVYQDMDFRRYNPLLTPEAVRETLGIQTKLNPLNLSLDSRKLEELDLLEEIGYTYASKLDWTQPNLKPWDTLGGRQNPRSLPTVDWSHTIYE